MTMQQRRRLQCEGPQNQSVVMDTPFYCLLAFVPMATQSYTIGTTVRIHLANKDFVTNLGVVIFLDFQRGLAQ